MERIDRYKKCVYNEKRKKERVIVRVEKSKHFEFLQKQEKNTEEWVVNKSAVEI